MSSVSLRPLDVSNFADRLLHDLPELRARLHAALGAAGRAAEASSPATAGALRDSGADLRNAVTGLDTSLSRLAGALKLAAADLITHDAQMFGRLPASGGPPPSGLDAAAVGVVSGGA